MAVITPKNGHQNAGHCNPRYPQAEALGDLSPPKRDEVLGTPDWICEIQEFLKNDTLPDDEASVKCMIDNLKGTR